MSQNKRTHKHRYDEDGFCKCGGSREPGCVCGGRGCNRCDDTERCVWSANVPVRNRELDDLQRLARLDAVA